MVNHLFIVPPDQILEHPDNLSKIGKEIPNGPIVGWKCYASLSEWETYGPFEAVVSRPYDDQKIVCIRIQRSKFSSTEFIFMAHDHDSNPNRMCWYQSSHTLRFIKDKQHPIWQNG